MLILMRRPGESIIIDNQINVNVLDVMNGMVKIGIDAPKNISVHRKEVQDKINFKKGV